MSYQNTASLPDDVRAQFSEAQLEVYRAEYNIVFERLSARESPDEQTDDDIRHKAHDAAFRKTQLRKEQDSDGSQSGVQG